eukprot:8377865-Alexandrium_andersonii.AAC.1
MKFSSARQAIHWPTPPRPSCMPHQRSIASWHLYIAKPLHRKRAQSAIRNPRKARQHCNPPQSAIRRAENAKSLQ